jgi:WD40 repeat protein
MALPVKISRAAVISPDGKRIAVNTFQGFALWELPSGRVLPALGSDALTETGVFTPQGNYFLFGGRGNVTCWGVQEGRIIHEIATSSDSPVEIIAVSADGRYLATAPQHSGSIQVFRLPTR